MVQNYLVQELLKLKNEYLEKIHSYNHIREFLPDRGNQGLLDKSHLEKLHTFFKLNKIYYKEESLVLGNIPCISYEGDINQFWLSSKKYDTNYQPFLPTWVLSALVMVQVAKDLGFENIIDIGSGDGRLLYCGSIIGLNSIGVEIDKDLCDLQTKISDDSNVKFRIINGDSNSIDYSQLALENTMLFVSALPESGEMISYGITNQFKKYMDKLQNVGITLMGSHTYRKYSRDKSMWGWGKFIDDCELKLVECLSLPTSWTLDEKKETPYLFTLFK
ncbi:MAG TPA: hypothetical protein VNA18_00155 [Nitrososphaeraceae archaeon]|nr:hypothetical protein [Nitrososphaeraceae archaeon]